MSKMAAVASRHPALPENIRPAFVDVQREWAARSGIVVAKPKDVYRGRALRRAAMVAVVVLVGIGGLYSLLKDAGDKSSLGMAMRAAPATAQAARTELAVVNAGGVRVTVVPAAPAGGRQQLAVPSLAVPVRTLVPGRLRPVRPVIEPR